MDTLHTQVEAVDTPVALAEAHIEPVVVAADRLLPVAAVHTVPALALAVERLAGQGLLRPPERFARHPQFARSHRNSCKICYPKRTVCHKKGKTSRLSYLENAFRGFSAKYHSPSAK